MTDQATPLTPEHRAHAPNPPGYAVRLADGNEWKLAYGFHVAFLDEHRDRIADAAYTDGRTDPEDILFCAFALLKLNYQVTPEEAWQLIGATTQADRQKLYDATIVCTIGPNPEKMRRTYSEWVRSALLANGLKAKDIAADDLPGVLYHLEGTGRILSPADFLSSARSAKMRAELLKGD